MIDIMSSLLMVFRGGFRNFLEEGRKFKNVDLFTSLSARNTIWRFYKREDEIEGVWGRRSWSSFVNTKLNLIVKMILFLRGYNFTFFHSISHSYGKGVKGSHNRHFNLHIPPQSWNIFKNTNLNWGLLVMYKIIFDHND